MSKMQRNLAKLGYRHGFNTLKQINRTNEHSHDQLFSDSFSVIAKQDRAKKVNGEEFMMSFMFDKENTKPDCQNCKESAQLILQREQ